MKRIAHIAALLALCLLASCGTDREHILKVYNWGDYIDEELIPEFEQWYEEQTGEPVKVVYQTFDINETMLSKIEKGHEDFDVVCPSDYIIQRMLNEGLLLPINKQFGNTPNYIDANVSPYIRGVFSKIADGGIDANDYSVGYMWGTTGILYNAKYVDPEDVKSWDVIRNPKYADKIFIKDAARDVYCPINIFLHQNELKAGEVTMDELMMDSSDESLEAFEAFMAQVKPLVAGWEADFGKEQMTQERGWLNFTWSGDAEWAMMEARELGVDLRYEVPQEDSNVWFDGWVIPKYARNVKAASYFINFLCIPENAIRNMDYIGYVSTVTSPEILEAMEDESFEETVDVRYLFGDIEGAGEAHLDPTLYPDASVIERCVMMRDWGEDTPKLITTWSRVKGSNANAMTMIVIGLFFAVLLVLGIRKKFFSKRRRRHHYRKK